MEVEPIRDVKKIEAMKKILRAGNRRDEVLFIMGINTALRISDILSLTVADVLDAKGRLASCIELKEKKTGKPKKFPINKAIRDALNSYLPSIMPDRSRCGNTPLFPSKKGGAAITRWHARRILAAAGEIIGLGRIGTHSLRKTFGYHVYQRTGGNLGLVQKLLNHSSSSDTLRYIGIDREQMDNTYLDLNL
jgi:integrase